MTEKEVKMFFDAIHINSKWYMEQFHADCIFGANLNALKKTFDLMPNNEIHKDLLFYIKHCMPSNQCIEPNLCFLSPSAIYSECTKYVPCNIIIKHGYLPFAKNGGGAPYAFRISDGKIFLFYVNDYSEGISKVINSKSVTVPPSEEILAEQTEKAWGSFSEFIYWYLEWCNT